MIRVCDSIMGTGKSSAAINYMNDNPDKKYIYITPYLEEAKRIKQKCPSLEFVEPSNKLKRYEFKKYLHTSALVAEGRNIATTHQAFKAYTPDMLDAIKDQHYTLIIDEDVEMLEIADVYPSDVQLAARAGLVDFVDGSYRLVDDSYGAGALSEMFRTLRSRELIRLTDDDEMLYFWVIPPDMLRAFDDVFILTYLFDGQSIHHMIKMNGLEYQMIGVSKDSGDFRFCDGRSYTPEYVYKLDELIDIYEGKMNEIGSKKYSLSKAWASKENNADVPKLKNNIYNFFNNVYGAHGSSSRLWSCYRNSVQKLKGLGYTKAFVPFNMKATNAYKDKTILAYAINIYYNVAEKIFYKTHGVEVDDDAYALSVMVQWIWRSAIREGKRIHLYIPSKRMRDILKKWIADTMEEANKE